MSDVVKMLRQTEEGYSLTLSPDEELQVDALVLAKNNKPHPHTGGEL